MARGYHIVIDRPAPKIGGVTVKRKHFWMPCILHEGFDDLPEEEQAKLYKATYWADNITHGEWKALLGHDDAKRYDKSRLKKKAAGWLMALARIAYLRPEFFAAVVKQARTMYEEQVQDKYPWAAMVHLLAGLEPEDEHTSTHVGMLKEGENFVRVPAGHQAMVFTQEMYDDIVERAERREEQDDE
jgi:hypothetical protein